MSQPSSTNRFTRCEVARSEADPESSASKIRQACSRGLVFFGVLVFLLGDRVLQAFAHYDFLLAEFIGMLSGFALAILGFVISQKEAVTNPDANHE
jgi:hypothetical protein